VANLVRLQATQSDAEELMSSFQSRFKLSAGAQLTRLERQVVTMIGWQTSAEFRQQVLSYLQITSFTKSPFTNDSLSTPGLALRWAPKAATRSRGWAERLATTEASLQLLWDRWVGWYEGCPDALKRKKSQPEIEEELARCALMCFVISAWRRDVPASSFEAVEDQTMSQFLSGFLDDQLDDAIRSMSASWSYDQMPMVVAFKPKQTAEARTSSREPRRQCPKYHGCFVCEKRIGNVTQERSLST